MPRPRTHEAPHLRFMGWLCAARAAGGAHKEKFPEPGPDPSVQCAVAWCLSTCFEQNAARSQQSKQSSLSSVGSEASVVNLDRHRKKYPRHRRNPQLPLSLCRIFLRVLRVLRGESCFSRQLRVLPAEYDLPELGTRRTISPQISCNSSPPFATLILWRRCPTGTLYDFAATVWQPVTNRCWR